MSATDIRIHTVRLFIGLLTVIMLAGLPSCKVQKTSVRQPETPKTERPAETPAHDDRGDSKKARELVAEARKWLGTKYRYGGHSLDGTDCSGMVMELYLKVYGLKLPRTSAQQQEYCGLIQRDELQTGDLLFFDMSKRRSGVSHVGLYIGNGEMIHASTRGVIVSRIDETYYLNHYHSSGRVTAVASGKGTRPSAKKDDSVRTPAALPDLNDVIDAKIDSIYSSMMD